MPSPVAKETGGGSRNSPSRVASGVRIRIAGLRVTRVGPVRRAASPVLPTAVAGIEATGSIAGDVTTVAGAVAAVRARRTSSGAVRRPAGDATIAGTRGNVSGRHRSESG
jgi:hypothetical protein